jgi:hypothetical protein
LSRKHGGSSGFKNLAYACVLCNRHKGSDVASINPETDEAVGYSILDTIDGQITSVSKPISLSHSRTPGGRRSG